MKYVAKVKDVDSSSAGSIAKAFYYDLRINHSESCVLITSDKAFIIGVEKPYSESETSELIDEITRHHIEYFKAGNEELLKNFEQELISAEDLQMVKEQQEKLAGIAGNENPINNAKQAGKPEIVEVIECTGNLQKSGEPENATDPENVGDPKNAGENEGSGELQNTGKPQGANEMQNTGEPEGTGNPTKSIANNQESKQNEEAMQSNIIEILNLATSQEDFINLLFRHFAFKEKYYGNFVALFEYALKLGEEELNWKKIENSENDDIKLKLHDRKSFTTCIKTMYDVSKKYSILNVIKVALFCLKSEKPSWFNISEEPQEVQPNAVEEELKATTQQYFPCVSVDIPEFNEKLSSLAIYKKPEAKASFILDCMGIDSVEKEEKSVILELVNVAINMKGSFTIKDVISKANLLKSETIIRQAGLYKFINQYFEAHGETKKISSIDFLVDLRNLVCKEID